MGHNVSDRKRLAGYLSQRLGEWRDWQLEVDCGGPACARGRRYAVGSLAEFYPRHTLGGAVRAMRCAVCRGPVTRAALHRFRRGKDPETVPLVGPGAMW